MVSLRDQEEIKIFLDELEENLDFLDGAIIALEKSPGDEETLEDIFRVAHTIKGSASFLDLQNLVSLGHSMENVFQEFKTGAIKVNKEVIDTLLACKDAIGKIGHLLGQGADTRTVQTQGLIDKVNSFLKHKNAPDSKNNPQHKEISENAKELGLDDYIPDTLLIRVWISQSELAPSIRAFLVHKRLSNLGEVVKQLPSEEEMDSDDFNISADREIRYWIKTSHSTEELEVAAKADLIDKVGIISENILKEIGAHAGAGKSDEAAPTQRTEVETSDSVRIPVSRLDIMLNLVGELVIANSGFLQISETLRNVPNLQNVFKDVRDRTKDLVRISSEIQGLVMNSRLVPISSVFNRFRRFVRDYSSKSGKKITLTMTGESTELDKKITDEMIKPLTHLVRNSLDHGLEMPEDRIKYGKNETGTLHLEAYQEGNYINIIIKDDGRGLNFEKIVQKAIERGIVTSEGAMSLSEEDIKSLIFQSGFSTKDEVDEMSGRGVGMDVVKRSVEDLHGTIILDSEMNKGTNITIKLPLTLAILNALIVKVGSERFCIPMSSIVETQKVNSKNFLTVDNNEMVRLRDKLIPVIRLEKIFPSAIIENKSSEPKLSSQKAFSRKLSENQSIEYPVIVVDYHTTSIAILVDQFLSRQEVVIKSLAEHYRTIDGISGASILGDGSIILIIDVHGVIQLFRNQRVKPLGEIGGTGSLRKPESKPIPISTAFKKPVTAAAARPASTATAEIPKAPVIKPQVTALKEVKLSDLSKMSPSEFEQLEDLKVEIVPTKRKFENKPVETKPEAMVSDEDIDIFPDASAQPETVEETTEYEDPSEIPVITESKPALQPSEIILEEKIEPVSDEMEEPFEEEFEQPIEEDNIDNMLEKAHEPITLENIDIVSEVPEEPIEVIIDIEPGEQLEEPESDEMESDPFDLPIIEDNQPFIIKDSTRVIDEEEIPVDSEPADSEEDTEAYFSEEPSEILPEDQIKQAEPQIQNFDFTEDDLNDIDIFETNENLLSGKSIDKTAGLEGAVSSKHKEFEEHLHDEISLESAFNEEPDHDSYLSDSSEEQGEVEISVLEEGLDGKTILDDTEEESFEFTAAADDSVSIRPVVGKALEQRLDTQINQDIEIHDDTESTLAVSPSSDIDIEEIEEEMMEMENLENQRNQNAINKIDTEIHQDNSHDEISEFQRMKKMMESGESFDNGNASGSIALSHFNKTDYKMDKLYDLLDGKNPELVKTWLKTGNERAIEGLKSLTGHENIFPGQTKAKRYSKEKLSSYIERFKEDDMPVIGLTLPMLPINGMIYFILNHNNARNMAEMLYQAAQMPAPETIDFEPLMEVTNILGSAFTNSLTQLTDIPIEPGIPQILENNELLVESMEEHLVNAGESSMLYIENEFLWGEKEVLAELIMMIPKII